MGKPARTQLTDDVSSNVALLETFWRRTPFHDMEITSIERLAGKVIISVGRYILVLLGVTRYEPKLGEIPTSWLYDTIDSTNEPRVLTVETESGKFSVAFRNLRLICDDDYAVLIPPLDN